MTSTRPRTRRTAAVLATTVAGVAASLTGHAADAARAEAAPVTPLTSVTSAAAAAQTTTLTFSVHDCDGCQIQPLQYMAGQQKAWSGKKKTVKDGTVSWTFATKHTHGMSFWIRAPWEGSDGDSTGFVANIVTRYDHEKAGSTVTRDDVRSKTKASGCWAGTDATEVTIPLEVRKVMVDGYQGKTPGTLAWTKVTQDWWRPILKTYKGILGSQDYMPCKKP